MGAPDRRFYTDGHMIHLNEQRLNLLHRLDASKPRSERNKVGQFATPSVVADEIVYYALQHQSKQVIRFIEPGFGTGAFFTSLLTQLPADRVIAEARGYEIDHHYAEPVRNLMAKTKADIRVEDFTVVAPEPFDLVLCNPPYVRHHHLSSFKKIELSKQIQTHFGIKTSGLTGLYNYFLMLGERWLAEDGISAWLVPSEFLDVNYGVAVKRFLLSKVTLTHIHLFESENVQFQDALVSSVVVWYRKGLPGPDHQIELSYGGSLLVPSHTRHVANKVMIPEEKWTRFIRQVATPGAASRSVKSIHTLKDFFEIKRGLATGDNQFFILNQKQVEKTQIPEQFLTPVLPSPRYLKSDIVVPENNSHLINSERLYLLNCRLDPSIIQAQYPTLWHYLKMGIGSVSNKYLCRSRKLWYLQEHREVPPILCSYMGRGSQSRNTPFRFILNESNAVATNSYLLLYPKPYWKVRAAHDPKLMRRVWEVLCAITAEDLIGEGRTYGGGLEKIEPSELGNVPVAELMPLLNPSPTGTQLFVEFCSTDIK